GLSSEELQEVFHISVQLSSVIPGKEVEDALSANAATEQLQANQQNLKLLADAELETLKAQGTALRAFIDQLGPGVSLADVAGYKLAETLERARQKGEFPNTISWQVSPGGANPTAK
ncbi:MAG: hypothetical protein KDD69_20485, partial [Bdellovibrionales bacterium]|nr:hypothetical protein [Bdellovibrionales bacterium]